MAVFVVSFFILVSAYGTLCAISLDKSLPRLAVFGNSIGLLKGQELLEKIRNLKTTRLNTPVSIKYQDREVKKTLKEFELDFDEKNLASQALYLGKLEDIFPSLSYLRQSAMGLVELKPKLFWKNNPQTIFENLFQNLKTEPTDAKIVLDGNKVKVEPEKEGGELDTQKLSADIEQCFLGKCSNPIVAKIKTKPCKITAAQLEPYINDLNSVINQQITLIAESRKFVLKPEEILSFFSQEDTLKNGKITWSDKAIEDYLNEKVASKVNVKGRTRQISTYDNSVIDEGREGKRLDMKKAFASIKEALENKGGTAELALETAPIEEERVGPGFTPNRTGGKYIEINLSEQTLYTLEGSNLIGSFRVSTGKWSMPTPIGEYAINSKDDRAYSQEYGLYMPYWMSFIGSQYGIHELPEWPGGAKEGEGHLGIPVSHGCVRLGVGSAKQVYDWAEIGTPVFIHR